MWATDDFLGFKKNCSGSEAECQRHNGLNSIWGLTRNFEGVWGAPSPRLATSLPRCSYQFAVTYISVYHSGCLTMWKWSVYICILLVRCTYRPSRHNDLSFPSMSCKEVLLGRGRLRASSVVHNVELNLVLGRPVTRGVGAGGRKTTPRH